MLPLPRIAALKLTSENAIEKAMKGRLRDGEEVTVLIRQEDEKLDVSARVTDLPEPIGY